ncbi:enoyl-CoA hydratase [Agaricicola taiwanensis]|uniref:Enoyl-CoA hydratase n=1 Tax=Agaricicola taiwanensis TaxID=591372 RepID=A0A8J3E0L3_9RHOB|nr:enoyl-CoA hydratase [Agaricicola taiwanensis]GGE54822.1 enoyl-CoA hydratase [Agaricicola taiwanensis]
MSVLLEEFDNGIVSLTLNRPDRMNAISPELADALIEAFTRLGETPDVAAVILTGAGRAFSSGGDVKIMTTRKDWTYEQRLNQLNHVHRIPLALHRMAKPTIALVNGVAVGAGLSLALACDFRIAGRSAKFAASFARVGLSGDYGGSWFMTRLIGTAKTRELYFSGEAVDAERAAREGLVNRMVEDADLASEGRAFASRFSGGPSLALGYMKKNLNIAETGSLEDVLAAEAIHQARVAMSDDHQEGVQAFIEKRPAKFMGR